MAVSKSATYVERVQDAFDEQRRSSTLREDGNG